MGIFGNGGWFNDVTSSLNPLDDENGPFQGSGGRVPIQPATAGPDLSGQYWNQYGQQAQDNLAQQQAAYQGALNQTAAQAGGSGQAYGQTLGSIGLQGSNAANQSAAGMVAAGGQYGSLMQGAGQQYAQNQAALGGQAQNYAVQQGGLATAAGGQLAGMGSSIYGQAAGAQGADVSGQQQAALMGLEANRGPSAAQGQLRQATNENQAAALAMARSGKGWGGSAGAMNQAASQRVGAQQQAANQSSVLAAQEENAWRQRQAANIAQSGQLATSQAGLNNAREQNLYQLGMSGVQSGGQMALQGGQLGLQGYGMNQQGMAGAAGTHLGALGQAASTNLGAMQAGGQLQQQGYGQYGQMTQAGGALEQTGYGNAGTMYGNAASYGLNNQAAQSGLVGQQYGLAQQHQQNQMNAAAINNGLAIQQQNMGNQMMGAYMGAAGSVIPMLAAASDRNVKEGIEPTNVTIAEPEEPTIVMPLEGTAQPLDQNGQAYDPYSFGTGVSGPNQAQGLASSDAAQSASVGQDAQRESASSKELKKISGGGGDDVLNGGKGMGGTMLTPMGAFGNAMKAGATNALGDTSVNPITGRSWFETSGGGGGYDPYQQPAMLPMQPVTSDEREKEAMRAFDETPGYSYNYKDPEMSGATDGRQFGIMAQDLEKTPAGKSVVKEGPNGVKMVDTSRLALVEGAALNGALKRIAELEKRLGSKGKAA